MKNKKALNLPAEPLKTPSPSKLLPYHKRKSIIDFHASNPKSLLHVKIRRLYAIKWNLSVPDRMIGQRRPSRTLGQSVGFDKSIKKLILYLSSELIEVDILYLVNGLKKIKALEGISLVFADHYAMTDTRLSHLMKGLKRLCWIKNISFFFAYSHKITDVGLTLINRSLKNMTFLKVISLTSFILSQVTDNGVKRLYGSLSRLTRLKSITLHLISFKKITDRSLASFSVDRLVSLKEVKFSFGFVNRLSDRGVDFLTQALIRAPNLQKVSLDYRGYQGLSNFGLLSFWKMMKNLSGLEEISFFANCRWVTNSGFAELNNIFEYSPPSFKKIHFEFDHFCGVTDSGLAFLCQFFERSVSLQDLFVEPEFYQNTDRPPSITDKSLFCLGEALKRLNSLQSLHIAFKNFHQITDMAVEKLIDCMKKLINLKRIGLDFTACKKITDKGLSYISQFLKSQTSLERIFLDVSQIAGATEEGMDNFRKRFKT